MNIPTFDEMIEMDKVCPCDACREIYNRDEEGIEFVKELYKFENENR